MLIIMIPFSLNGIIVFKHICNSTNTVKFYLYVNEKCSDEKEDTCCNETISKPTEESCCEDTHSDCESSHKNSEMNNIYKSEDCCFDDSQIFSVKADLLNKDKITKIFYQSVFYLLHYEKIKSDTENLYLTKSEILLFSPPTSKIISFIVSHSSDKSSDSYLS
ncbi:MAG: hypothetical protein N2319_02365 [Candidatus Kapabacteria bacterium]|nr:hypothetical protein [Candidatus Kapabacteria bacterium]